MESYSDPLKRPEWQKKRLEIMQRDGFKCRYCGSDNKTLHIHHLAYSQKSNPWDINDEYLITLCYACHEMRSESEAEIKKLLATVELLTLDKLIYVLKYAHNDANKTIDAVFELTSTYEMIDELIDKGLVRIKNGRIVSSERRHK